MLDWPAVMQAFEDIGYDGWATGEMIPAYGHASDQIIYNGGLNGAHSGKNF